MSYNAIMFGTSGMFRVACHCYLEACELVKNYNELGYNGAIEFISRARKQIVFYRSVLAS